MMNTLKSVNVQIDARKLGNDGLGFSMNTDPDDNSHIVIEMVPGGLAETAGLKVGDRVTMMNDKDAINMSHNKLVKTLRKSKRHIFIQVTRDESPIPHLISNEPENGEGAQDNEEAAHDNEEAAQDNEEAAQENEEAAQENEQVVNEIAETTEAVPLQEKETADPNYAKLCTVRLSNNQTYGFTVIYLSSSPTYKHVVSLVNHNSPAYDANVRADDILIEVNRTNVENSTHEEVIEQIKSVTQETTVLVVDKDAWNYFRKMGIPITSDMDYMQSFCNTSMGFYADIESEPAQESEPVQQAVPELTTGTRVCTVSPVEGESFGMTLTRDETTCNHVVSAIFENSPAYRGQLQENDIVMEVNDTNVANMSHTEVVNLIKNNTGECQFLVFNPSYNAPQQDEPEQETVESTCETVEPTCETAEPTVETAESTVETAEPIFDTAEPTYETAEPRFETMEPECEVEDSGDESSVLTIPDNILKIRDRLDQRVRTNMGLDNRGISDMVEYLSML